MARPPHAVGVPEIHQHGDGLPAAAARGLKEVGDTAFSPSKGMADDTGFSETATGLAEIHHSHTPSAVVRLEVHFSAVDVDTSLAAAASPTELTPSPSAGTQLGTASAAPAGLNAPATVPLAAAAEPDGAVSSDLRGVEVGAGVSPGGSSAAVVGGLHLQGLGLPSVGWLTAQSLSGWLGAESVIPALARGPAAGPGGESNQPRAEAPSAGVIGSTSAVGVDVSDPSASAAQDGMPAEPQEGATPGGAQPIGDPGQTEKAPAGPAGAGAPDATGPGSSGEIRTEGGEPQAVAAPAPLGGDVTGLEGAVGQLFGWVTDLSSLSAGNKLGLYLALFALGSAAAAAELRRRQRRAGSENTAAATRQPHFAGLGVRMI
jgi:hypothetical protein